MAGIPFSVRALIVTSPVPPAGFHSVTLRLFSSGWWQFCSATALPVRVEDLSPFLPWVRAIFFARSPPVPASAEDDDVRDDDDVAAEAAPYRPRTGESGQAQPLSPASP